MRFLALALCSALIAAPLATGVVVTGAWAQTQPPRGADRPQRPDEPATAQNNDTERGDHSERTQEAKAAKISDADIATAPVKEQRSVTHHTVTIDGKAIAYEATAGTLTLRDDQGKPIASMFYVAYVADHGKGDAHRPVTFFYNGGPGSASLWLHMGSFGPVRVHTASPDATGNAPFELTNNNESLLDKTDMVFLDAIGAGYSRPLGETKGDKFWGVDQDIDAFARGIKRYLSNNNRWNSPKYLFGESYGTTRSAGLSYALQEQGVQLNGVMLLSSILNYSIRAPGYDRLYAGYVPSYAAAAWYHNKLGNKPADLPAYLAEVRAWANGPYLTALTKGDDLPPQEEAAIAQQLSAYTGLSLRFLEENRLRVDLNRFRKELLRDEHRTIGRYDSRFKGMDADDGAEGPETDPSDTGISGAFIGSLHDYLVTQLNYHTDLDYWPSGQDINRNWDWHHKAPGARFPETQPDVALDLSQAMRQNPHLRVYSLNGWYDMATPFFETEYDLHHMSLDPTLKGNLKFAYYPSGHMVYLNPDALKQLKADVSRFYDEGQ
jgi:carboxypeptidase C (cathepsin A)